MPDMDREQKQVRWEDGVIVGTSGGKYQTRNPVGRWLLNNFDRNLVELLKPLHPKRITEVGCGEGHITQLLLRHTDAPIRALDISDDILDDARAQVNGDPRVRFLNRSIFDLEPGQDAADLVVCCEVLEHLENPEAGLTQLLSLTRSHALLSVPREPIFRAMNFARGAYLSDFGNSPGHIQHWSRSQFLRFLGDRLSIREVRSPLPWTMVLLEVR
ncbi:MAG: methyltransferase [Pseudomonadota bacterium]